MKKFGEGQQPFHAIIDIPEGDSQELTTVTDQALNSLYGELFNLLANHGINPTATTNADLKQVARAVWAAVSAGTLFIDTGTANVKMLTHARGDAFLYRNGNSGDAGFTVEFLNKVENTGAVTVNVFDVENNQNHFNNVPLLDVNGNGFAAAALPANSMIKAYYDYNNNFFRVINIYNTRLNDSVVLNIDNKPLRNVALQYIESINDLASIAKTQNRMVFVKSYVAGKNKGGGFFVYDDALKNTNDGGTIFNGWRRLVTGELNANMFGAVGDGVTNDSPAFQKYVDYCEKNQYKKLLVLGGDHLFLDKVYFYRGGVNVIGIGALQREESWIGVSVRDYSSMVAGRDGDAFKGCSIIVPKNSTAFVFAESVVDHVYFENLQFTAKEGRTVGYTNAIDFFATFNGPTWTFRVQQCNFRGFNKVVNFKSTTQYCVAFVDVSKCSFSQNDEVLYFSDILDSNIGIIGSRNVTWGLKFTQNKCHDNSRLIRACCAKDLVEIKENNLEGSIPYSNGTSPKYSIDLEIYNCQVDFIGNHGESSNHGVLFCSSYMRDKNGNRLPFEKNQTRGGYAYFRSYGNNFDGVANIIPITLEGMGVYNNDSYPIALHGCAIVDNAAGNHNFIASSLTATEASAFLFSIGSHENIALAKNNGLASIAASFIPPNKDSFVAETPLGNRHITQLYSEGGVHGYQYLENLKNAKYFGASILVNNNKAKGFLSSLIFFVTYKYNGANISTSIDATVLNTTAKGWFIATTFIPVSVLPSGAEIISVYAAVAKNSLSESNNCLIDNMMTVFTIDTDTYKPAPYIIPNEAKFTKAGTFEKWQQFVDENTGVLNVCTDNGTIGDELSITAVSEQGKNFFTTENGNALAVGAYITINNINYKISNIKDNVVYVNKPIETALQSVAVKWKAPVFKNIQLVQ